MLKSENKYSIYTIFNAQCTIYSICSICKTSKLNINSLMTSIFRINTKDYCEFSNRSIEKIIANSKKEKENKYEKREKISQSHSEEKNYG